MRPVSITSLRGENLIPQDGKTCDPYVEMRIGEHTAKTEKVSSNHVNPSWSNLDGFSFPWDGVGSMPVAEFFAWDFDYIGYDDFIGYARVPLHKSMLSGQEIQVRLGIRNDDDKHLLNQYGTLGKLYFKLTEMPESVGPTPRQPGSQKHQQQQPLQRHASVVLANHANTITQPPHMDNSSYAHNRSNAHKDLYQSTRLVRNPSAPPEQHHGGHGAEYVLTSILCEGIPAEDRQQLFVAMWYREEEEWRTHSLPVQRGFVGWSNLHVDVTHAMGNSLLQFAILRRDEQGHLRVVVTASCVPHLTSLNADVKLLCTPTDPQHQHDLQAWGTITFVIHGVAAEGGHRSRASTPQSMNPYPTGDILSVAPPVDGMLLRIVSASDLLPLDYNEEPDPFVVVHWKRAHALALQEVFRTQTHRNTNQPFFNEIHEIRHISKHASRLVFSVFDLDPHNLDFAGTCELDFLNVEPKGSFDFELYGRADDAAVAAQDDAILRRFGRESFGILTLQWNIDPNVQHRNRQVAQQEQQQQLQYEASMMQSSQHYDNNSRTHPQQQHPSSYHSSPHQQHIPSSNKRTVGAATTSRPRDADPYNADHYYHHPDQQNTASSATARPAAPAPQFAPQPPSAPTHFHGTPIIDRHVQHMAPTVAPPIQTNNSSRVVQQGSALRRRQPPGVDDDHHHHHGAVLVLTVLSMTNLQTRDPGVCPYVRIALNDESKDNCAPDLVPVTEAVWNFKTEFYIPDPSNPATTPLSPYQQRGQLPQQQQRSNKNNNITIEICDARNHGVIAIATVPVPSLVTR